MALAPTNGHKRVAEVRDRMLAADEMSLTSGKSLAGFHGARSILYLAVWRLFSRDYSDEATANLRALIAAGAATLGRPEPWRVLEQMLSESGEELERARAFVERFPCNRGLAADARDIFSSVGIENVTTPADEAHALGLLAQQAATALNAGNLPKAAEVDEMQVRLLEGHAAGCLGDLCAGLAASEDAFLRQLGAALAWLIDNDLSLLDARAATAR